MKQRCIWKTLLTGLCLLILLTGCGAGKERDTDMTGAEPAEQTAKNPPDDLTEPSVLDGLTEPPTLEVTCGEARIQAWRGTYGWMYPEDDGSIVAVEADSIHPLELGEELPCLRAEEGSTCLTLRFAAAPDSCQARAWSSNWLGCAEQGDRAAMPLDCPDSEPLTLTLDVPMDPYTTCGTRTGLVYEIHACWEGYGDAYYAWLVQGAGLPPANDGGMACG